MSGTYYLPSEESWHRYLSIYLFIYLFIYLLYNAFAIRIRSPKDICVLVTSLYKGDNVLMIGV